MPTWSPDQWNDFGLVGFALFIMAFLALALMRGWIVLGPYHREIVTIKDDEIKQLRVRGVHDATAIDTLSKSMVDKNAAEDATTKILAALRDVVASGGDR